MGFVLSPLAQADLDDIWDYTANRWNIVQAERYLRLIGDAIAAAAARPKSGRACDHIRPGYFKVRAQSHVVFYRLTGADIDVVRVLHGRMDIRRHL